MYIIIVYKDNFSTILNKICYIIYNQFEKSEL